MVETIILVLTTGAPATTFKLPEPLTSTKSLFLDVKLDSETMEPEPLTAISFRCANERYIIISLYIFWRSITTLFYVHCKIRCRICQPIATAVFHPNYKHQFVL